MWVSMHLRVYISWFWYICMKSHFVQEICSKYGVVAYTDIAEGASEVRGNNGLLIYNVLYMSLHLTTVLYI